MNIQTIDISKLIVTQSNDLARARYSMTLQEKRLLLLLASMVRKEHRNFYRYRIPVIDLSTIFEIDPKNLHREVSKVCDKLLSRVVHINRGDDWEKFQWVSYANYIKHDPEFDGAVLELKIHDEMKPHFLELNKRFASTPLYQIAHLPSFHSLRLFLILWHESHRMKRPEFHLNLDDLKERLELTGKYKNYKDFKRRILLKAQKDFAQFTPIRFEFSEETQGRKVVKINFSIITNKQPYQLSLDIPKWLRYTAEMPPQDEQDFSEHQTLIERLINEFGIKSKQAIALTQQFDKAYIVENLKLVKHQYQQGRVRNLPAFTYKAIMTDYRSKEDLQKQQRYERHNNAQKQQEALEEAYDQARQSVIKELKNSFDCTELVEDFRDNLPEIAEKYPMLKDTSNKFSSDITELEKHSLLRVYFHQYLLDNYALPYIRSFEAWQAEQAIVS